MDNVEKKAEEINKRLDSLVSKQELSEVKDNQAETKKTLNNLSNDIESLGEKLEDLKTDKTESEKPINEVVKYFLEREENIESKNFDRKKPEKRRENRRCISSR